MRKSKRFRLLSVPPWSVLSRSCLVLLCTVVGLNVATGTFGHGTGGVYAAALRDGAGYDAAKMLKPEFFLRDSSTGNIPVYSVGELVTLKHQLTNVAERYAHTDVGFSGEGWFALSVEDATGKPVPEIPGSKPRPLAGFQVIPSGCLAPREFYTGEISLGARFALTKPGRYAVRITVDTPYLDLGEAHNPPMYPYERLKASPFRIRGEYVLPFWLVQGDPEAQERAVSTLRRRFVLEKDATRRTVLAKELFSQPEAIALRQWRSVAFDPAADRALVARELATRVCTLEAARILIDVEFETPITDTRGERVSTIPLLTELLRRRPELHQDIDALLARRSKGAASVPMIFD